MKRSFLKLFSSLLIMLLVLSMFIGCGQTETPTEKPTDIATEAPTGKPADTSTESPTEQQEEKQKDIVILYTGDVHCGVEENMGYAGLASYKSSLEENNHVTLVDLGDAVQGDFLGKASGGEYIVSLMNNVGYDIALLGNHEFDYGIEQLINNIELSKAQYLGCNLTYSGAGTGVNEYIKPYEIIEYGDVSVGFVGVLTPETITSSTPAYFKENGEYVYSFNAGNDGADLYACVQENIDACRAGGADHVVVMAHMGNDIATSSPFTSTELIQNTTGVDVVLDAHAHNVIDSLEVANKDGDKVILSATGTKFQNIGHLTISADGHIDTKLVSEVDGTDSEVQAIIDAEKAKYTQLLDRVVANIEYDLILRDENNVRIVRSRETGLGNFCADAYRYISGADIAFVNGGGIRAEIAAGDITFKEITDIHPYGNYLCVIEATGSEILDILEMSVKQMNIEADSDDGGFLQVSGIKFKVDLTIDSPVVLDPETSDFVGVEGQRRVNSVMVLNDEGEYEPLRANKTYTVAAYNYMIKDGGDGYSMLSDNTLVIDEGILDYEILINYISETMNGTISERYASTEGRIIPQTEHDDLEGSRI